MKLTIVDKKEQKGMKRSKLLIKLMYDNAVPSRKEIVEALTKQTSSKNVIVERISPHYGERAATVHAYIYDDEKAMNDILRKHIKKRHEEKKKEGE